MYDQTYRYVRPTPLPILHRYHNGDPVFITAQVNKPTKKHLMAEDGTMVWELGFLCDVPGGVSGGVFLNDKGEAVGSLSHRSERDKMTYAICLSCKASKDYFNLVLQRNGVPRKLIDSNTYKGPMCVSPHDMSVIKEAAASMKKSLDTKIGATNEYHRKSTCYALIVYNFSIECTIVFCARKCAHIHSL